MPAPECKLIHDGLLGDALDFLSKNVIFIGGGPQTGIPTSAAWLYDFKQDSQTPQGGYQYSAVAPGNPHLINGLLEASFLPWGRDTGYYIILEPVGGPDIMFTAGLTGCSVGYVRASDGAVRVSHHNMQTNDLDDLAMQQADALAFAKPHKVLEADYNRPSEAEVKLGRERTGFVFGVRHGRNWTMYIQRTTCKMIPLGGDMFRLSDFSVIDAATF